MRIKTKKIISGIVTLVTVIAIFIGMSHHTSNSYLDISLDTKENIYLNESVLLIESVKYKNEKYSSLSDLAGTETQYISNDTDIITIDSHGYVMPKSIGTTSVGIKVVKDGKFYSTVVPVSVVANEETPIIETDKIKLKQQSSLDTQIFDIDDVSVFTGKSVKVPIDDITYNVSYVSTKPSIASVVNNAVVGHQGGTCQISAIVRDFDNNKIGSKSFNVFVNSPVTDIECDSVVTRVGSRFELNPVLLPVGANIGTELSYNFNSEVFSSNGDSCNKLSLTSTKPGEYTIQIESSNGIVKDVSIVVLDKACTRCGGMGHSKEDCTYDFNKKDSDEEDKREPTFVKFDTCKICGKNTHADSQCAKYDISVRKAFGRWIMPSANLNVAVFKSNSQVVCDAIDSACFFKHDNAGIIGDHDYQGFVNIKNIYKGDTAYLVKGSEIEVYKCFKVGEGYKITSGPNKSIYDANGQRVKYVNPNGITLYTCNGSFTDLYLAYFEKVDTLTIERE